MQTNDTTVESASPLEQQLVNIQPTHPTSILSKEIFNQLRRESYVLDKREQVNSSHYISKKRKSNHSIFRALCGLECLNVDFEGRREELEEELAEELLTILCLAKTQVAPSQYPDHAQILSTLYFNLCGVELNTSDPNMKSDDWMTVGFLSNDPISEFRSMGLLGAIMLLFLSEHEKPLVTGLNEISAQNKNLSVCMSLLHIGKVAIDQVKSGKINKYMNRELYRLEDEDDKAQQQDCYPIVGDSLFSFYVYLTKKFLKIWRKKKYAEMQFQDVLEKNITDNTDKIIKSWIAAERRKRKGSQLQSPQEGSTDSSQSEVPFVPTTPDQ